MFQCYFTCHKSIIEAIAGSAGSNHRHGALAIAAIQCLHQIRLLCLRRQTSRRTATLHIHYHQRQFSHHSQATRFSFQCQTGTGSCRNSKITGITCTDSRTDSSDFIFRLVGLRTQIAAQCQLMQNIGSRSYRIRATKQRQSGFLRSRQQSPGCRLVSGDGAVFPLFYGSRSHFKMNSQSVYVGSIIISCTQHQFIGSCNCRLFGKFHIQKCFGMFYGTFKHPVSHTQSKHILTP